MPIDLVADGLEFSFPKVHRDAVLKVRFQRTLRVPDDGQTFDLPPGLGEMPLRRVDQLPANRIPRRWLDQDGDLAISAVMPMWQSEACWLSFNSQYTFLVKVAAGRVNAVTGGTWSPRPDFGEEDYFEVPSQPWLDGFCTNGGVVRQFVAMPLGGGYSVEEQVSGRAEYGGIQIAVTPIAGSVHRERTRAMLAAPRPMPFAAPDAAPFASDFAPNAEPFEGDSVVGAAPLESASTMGLAPGGSIAQAVAVPVEPWENWEVGSCLEARVHITNSAEWQLVAGTPPPHLPLSAADYTRHGYPWFAWYDDAFARAGSSALARLDSVARLSEKRAEQALPENDSFDSPEPMILGTPLKEDGQPA